MSESKVPLAAGSYVGSPAEELARRKRGHRIAAGVDQRVLFPRTGRLELHHDRLMIGGWHGGSDLVLRPAEVRSVTNEYTDLYGRFVGGLLNSGRPLIVETVTAGEIYLMVDHKTFLETTSNRKWTRLLKSWLMSGDG
ncbi:hypothetical protein AB5J56_02165 [Streptomyces sp. R21]|uniref:Uncharacterized protein n=1 Tax=Streptomyces sp. R21 TaxID=3238627 RepID=A0AB39NZ69_9ACTN